MAGEVIKALIKGSKKPVSKLIKQADEGDFSEKVVLQTEPVEKAVITGKEETKAAINKQSVDSAVEGGAEAEVQQVVTTETQQVVPTTDPENIIKPEPQPTKKDDDANVETTQTQTDESAKVGMGQPLPVDPVTNQKQSNISLKNAQTTDDINALINRTADENEAFEKSRRGVVSNEQTVDESSNYSMEDLLGRKPGEAFNAAQVTSARQILIKSAQELKVMAQKIMDGNATEKDMLEFRQMGASHTAIQYQVSGMTAEAGRALQAFRITATGDTQVSVVQMRHALELSGGSTSAEAMAKLVLDSQDLASLNKATRETYGIKTTDLFFEYWINGLLSGPTTHMVNMLSNAAVMVHGTADRAAANMWGTILRSSPEDKIYAQEAEAQLLGMIMGFEDALNMSWKSLKTGQGQFDSMGKVEQRKYNSIDSVKVGDLMQSRGFGNIDKDSNLAKGIDLLGEFMRLPGRALQAEDDMFKVLNYRMELNALAIRQARGEGHKGQALADRILELIEKPTEEIHLGAVHFARENTFTNALGADGRKLQGIINDYPVLKIMMPFMRTLVNIQKYTLKHTPLALFAQSVRNDLRKGGAARDLALGKMTVGSMFSGYGLYMAMNGQVTGGGHNWRGVRASDYRQGWQAYSIKGPDGQWVKYDRFDPVGMYFGLVADAYEISVYGTHEDATEAAQAVAMALYKNMTNKTYAKGFTDFHEALTKGGGYWTRWVENFAASTVPYTSLISTGKRMVDPVIRDAQGVIEKIRSRTPGLSGDLPPRVNLYGEALVMEGGMMARGMNPFRTATPEPTYVDTQVRENEVNVVGVRDYLGDGRFKVPLDTWQHHDYQVLAGQSLYFELENMMMGNAYQDATTGPDGGRASMIKQKVKELRGSCNKGVCNGAVGLLLEKYPGLRLEYDKQKQLKQLYKEGY